MEVLIDKEVAQMSVLDDNLGLSELKVTLKRFDNLRNDFQKRFTQWEPLSVPDNHIAPRHSTSTICKLPTPSTNLLEGHNSYPLIFMFLLVGIGGVGQFLTNYIY